MFFTETNDRLSVSQQIWILPKTGWWLVLHDCKLQIFAFGVLIWQVNLRWALLLVANPLVLPKHKNSGPHLYMFLVCEWSSGSPQPLWRQHARSGNTEILLGKIILQSQSTEMHSKPTIQCVRCAFDQTRVGDCCRDDDKITVSENGVWRIWQKHDNGFWLNKKLFGSISVEILSIMLLDTTHNNLTLSVAKTSTFLNLLNSGSCSQGLSCSHCRHRQSTGPVPKKTKYVNIGSGFKIWSDIFEVSKRLSVVLTHLVKQKYS